MSVEPKCGWCSTSSKELASNLRVPASATAGQPLSDTQLSESNSDSHNSQKQVNNLKLN